MINNKFIFLLCLVACEEDSKQSIFNSKELYSYESEQHTQVFNPKINTNNKLDILLVIDNSGSMYDYQKNLSTKLESLLEHINDTDWQIAITSSDTRDGIASVISKEKGNQNEFGSTITNLGIDGIGNEAIVFKATQALKGNYLLNNDLGLETTQIYDCWINQSCDKRTSQMTRQISSCKEREHWLRDDSMLAILLITDEEHQCHDRVFGCTINDFYFYLKSIREPKATAKVYGLFCLKDENECARELLGRPTNKGSKTFARWRDEDGEGLFEPNGVASIRDADYSKTLKAISQSIATSIEENFTLEHVHDGKGDTSVTFITTDGNRERLAEAEYRITGNTLVVIRKPPDNIEKIEVSYSYGK